MKSDIIFVSSIYINRNTSKQLNTCWDICFIAFFTYIFINLFKYPWSNANIFNILKDDALLKQLLIIKQRSFSDKISFYKIFDIVLET